MIKNTSACKVILRNWERQICAKNEDCFKKKYLHTTLAGWLVLGGMFILKDDQCVSHREDHSQPGQQKHPSNYPPSVVFTVYQYFILFLYFNKIILTKAKMQDRKLLGRALSAFTKILNEKTFDQFSRDRVTGCAQSHISSISRKLKIFKNFQT